MNNKPCGCGKTMPPKAMPRCMAMKPGCTCRNNNWSNDNACNAKTCQTPCSMGCDKKGDCTSNVLSNENKCETKCSSGCGMPCGRKCDDDYGMPCAKKCGKTCDVDWAKKYERSCTRDYYHDGCEMAHKYRRCNKGCELTFGEEVDDLPIGMGYVPYQKWDCNVSNACQGLYDGTIFPELVKPFVCTYCYEERSCHKS